MPEAEHEVGLIEPREHVETRLFGRSRHGGQIDVRRDVGVAGLLEKVGELRVLLVRRQACRPNATRCTGRARRGRSRSAR